MQYVLNQLGIQAAYITGQAKGQSHAWNLVWLDGTPCWVDPTWGDPVFAGGEESQGPAYAYFGLTTADLLRTHTIDGSIPVPECVSNDANYFYRSGLYFTSYHASALTSAIQRRGRGSVPCGTATRPIRRPAPSFLHRGSSTVSSARRPRPRGWGRWYRIPCGTAGMTPWGS